MARAFLLIQGAHLRSKMMKRNKRQLLMKMERLRKNLAMERLRVALCSW